MLHWTILGWEPGIHDASLRTYGNELVCHNTVYFLFTLLTVTCKYSTLTLLTYHFASYNICSDWQPPTSMQTWHRRTRFCRTLTNIPDVFWIISLSATILVTNSMSVSTGIANKSDFRYSHRKIMKGIQVRWPSRPRKRASSSNPATRKYSIEMVEDIHPEGSTLGCSWEDVDSTKIFISISLTQLRDTRTEFCSILKLIARLLWF